MKQLILYKKTVILLFIIAFLIRLIIGLYSYKNKVWDSFHDDNARVKYATSIIENGVVPDIDDYYTVESIFAPVIPTVLAIKIILFGDSWLPVFILNAFLGAITCLLIYYIALYFFSKKIALLSFAWAAFYPNFIRYTGTSGNEPWIVFLFVLTFLFAIKTIKIQKINHYLILYSLFLTILFHTDERYITYSLLFTLFLFIGNSNIFLKLKKIALFILLTVLFSTPWLIRNYIFYDDVVLISCKTNNLTYIIFKHREELMFFDHTPNTGYFSPAQIDSVQQGLLKYYPLTPNKIPIRESQLKAMKSGNIPHKFNTKEKILSRIYYLWMPLKLTETYRITGYTFVNKWSLKHNLMTGLSYGLLLPFVLLALIVLIKQKRWKEVWLFAGIMFYHTFIHVAFIPYTRDRYRHPIDFIIIILGCYGIWICYSYFKSKLSISKGNTL